MQLHRYDQGYDIAKLQADAQHATSRFQWSRGAWGHSLSLPRARQVHPTCRYLYQNSPFAGLLDDCLYFREIFDSFSCDKASFRLLRRSPGTSYAWHSDRTKGRSVARFQIPIVADDRTQLIVTDFDSVAELVEAAGDPDPHPDAVVRASNGRARAYQLEPGLLFYFNTSKVHTLLNAGDRERLTLSFDLVADAPLVERFPEISTEVGDPPLGLPALGFAERARRYGKSRLFPLRNGLQRLLGRRDQHLARPTSDLI